MRTYAFAFRLGASSELCRLPVRTEAMAMSYARAALLEAVAARGIAHAYVAVGRYEDEQAVCWLGAWDWFERLNEAPLWTSYAGAMDDAPAPFPGSIAVKPCPRPGASPHR